MDTKKMVRLLGIIALAGMLDLNGASAEEKPQKRLKSGRTRSESNLILALAHKEATARAIAQHGPNALSPIFRGAHAVHFHDVIADILSKDALYLAREESDSHSSSADNSPSDERQ
jgi:hypothetical protein